jgi:hypothetical protein
MKKNQVAIFFSLTILSCGFTNNADINKGDFNKNIPIGHTKELKTEINFAVGDLNIKPCSNHLAEGEYNYSDEKLKPVISFNEESGKGYLKISAFDDNEDKDYNDSDSCQWNIALNKNIKNGITVKMIAGKGNIDLHDCAITRFETKMAAGELDINLRNTSVPNLNFKAIAGEAVIDLSGKWKNDLNADIKGGVGEITLKLPSQVGIRMNITGLIGDIDTPGFTKEGNTYTNDSYGKTDETLYIELTGGVGNVSIELVD